MLKILPFKSILFVLFALALAACQAFPVPNIETPRQALDLSYTTLHGMANTVTIAYQAEQIDIEQSTLLKRKLQEAKDNLDLAKASLMLYESTGQGETMDDFNGKLTHAEAILTAVQAFMEGT